MKLIDDTALIAAKIYEKYTMKTLFLTASSDS